MSTDFIDEETNPEALSPYALVDAALSAVLADLPSPCSRRAYGVDWARFAAWLSARGTNPLEATP